MNRTIKLSMSTEEIIKYRDRVIKPGDFYNPHQIPASNMIPQDLELIYVSEEETVSILTKHRLQAETTVISNQDQIILRTVNEAPNTLTFGYAQKIIIDYTEYLKKYAHTTPVHAIIRFKNSVSCIYMDMNREPDLYLCSGDLGISITEYHNTICTPGRNENLQIEMNNPDIMHDDNEDVRFQLQTVLTKHQYNELPRLQSLLKYCTETFKIMSIQ